MWSYLERGNHVEMRSLAWTLIKYDWCPYKRGKCGHKYMQEELQVKTGVMLPQAKELLETGESWNR
jgi:hypothetical protein